jgi:hypothetical protein
MINRIIYINYQPFSLKYYLDYYLQDCLNNQLDVEYWDLSKLYFPNVSFSEGNEYKIVVKKINTLKELKFNLKNNNNHTTIFITNITYEFRVWKFFRILTLYNCKLIFFARGMYPMQNKSTSSKIKEVVLKLNYKRIISGIKNKLSILFKKYKFIKSYDIVFRAGSEGGLTIGYGSDFDLKHANIVDINYFDYDNYLSVINNNSKPLIDGEYCVFLDQYLAFHPDIAICGLKNVNPTIYYSELNNYFEFIESKYNLKVVIAAHPKAIGYKINNPFLGRQIIFEKTCELVKDSNFVLTHHSTAISYPILFNKPIIFLNSCELEQKMPDLYDLTIYLGDYLNCEVVNFDELNDTNDLNLVIDISKYNNYINKYLSSSTTQKRISSEIFLDKIMTL